MRAVVMGGTSGIGLAVAEELTSAGIKVPAGRIGTPADVAGAVGYLVGAGMVTGTILPADGGFTVA
jgi:NAD(P)-dependent dehydrogenase (short-subunit alcohol dehydrogenase family)